MQVWMGGISKLLQYIHAQFILGVLCAVGGSRAKTVCYCRPVVIIIASLKEPLYVGDCMKAAK